MFAFSFLFPIHWAKANPGQVVTISTQMLILGPMLILGGFVVAARFGENKTILIISSSVGVGICILLLIELVSILNKIFNGH